MAAALGKMASSWRSWMSLGTTLVKVQALTASSGVRADELRVKFPVMLRVMAEEGSKPGRRHVGVDIVAVLDISGSMLGEKLDRMKDAMTNAIDKLGPHDRLSIVAFESSVERLTELTYMSDQGRIAARDKIRDLFTKGGTDMAPALYEAAQILRGRPAGEQSSRIGCILFLSDGLDSGIFKANISPDFPAHTFGLGDDHDPVAMKHIADKTSGTYSFVNKDTSKIKDAFAVFITGITSVVATSAEITLATHEDVSIAEISSGGYRSEVNPDGRSGTIRVDDLYAGDRKNFVVYLKLPVRAAGDGKQKVLSVGGQYMSLGASTKQIAGTDVSVLRPGGQRKYTDRLGTNDDVASEVARGKLVEELDKLVKQATVNDKVVVGTQYNNNQQLNDGRPDQTLQSAKNSVKELMKDEKDAWRTAQAKEVQLVKILCKGGDNLYVSMRGDDVVLAREDPRDETQQWFRDYSRSRHVTDDNNGLNAFALVNKATGQVMVNKKTTAADLSYFPVQRAPYNDDERADSTMLWTQLEKEHGHGFHQLAVLWHIGTVMDGQGGNVREGTIVGCFPTHYSYEQNVHDNQLWKILPVDGSSNDDVASEVARGKLVEELDKLVKLATVNDKVVVGTQYNNNQQLSDGRLDQALQSAKNSVKELMNDQKDAWWTALAKEVQEMKSAGLPFYLLSWLSSHNWQRATTKDGLSDTADFLTPGQKEVVKDVAAATAAPPPAPKDDDGTWKKLITRARRHPCSCLLPIVVVTLVVALLFLAMVYSMLEARSSTKAAAAMMSLGPLQYPMLSESEGNYAAWAIKMEAYMRAQGVWDAVAAKDPKKVSLRKDQMALAAIYQAIPERTLFLLSQEKTARSAWEALGTMHIGDQRLRDAKLQTLRLQFEGLRMKETDSVDNFATWLTTIVNKMQAVGQHIPEPYVVKKLLRAMPSRYLHIASTIEQFANLDTMTLQEVLGRLKVHEERLGRLGDAEKENELMTRAVWKVREEAEESHDALSKLLVSASRSVADKILASQTDGGSASSSGHL